MRLAGRAGERDVDGVVGQALRAVAPGDLRAEQGADGAVDVAHRQLQPHRVGVLERALGELRSASGRAPGRARGPDRAARRRWSSSAPCASVGTAKIGVRSRPLLFQCATPLGGVEHLGVADGLVDAAEAQLGQVLPDVLGDEPEEVLHELRLAVEARPQFGVLGRDADGQVSRWQTRIMMQPDTTSGAVAKPNSSAPSSAATITSRAVRMPPSHCTVMRSRSPLSTSVCWVSARPISHGAPACLSEVSGAAPVPPS